MHGSTAIVNGNQRSCGQDALVNGAKALGIVITKAQVHDGTFASAGGYCGGGDRRIRTKHRYRDAQWPSAWHDRQL